VRASGLASRRRAFANLTPTTTTSSMIPARRRCSSPPPRGQLRQLRPDEPTTRATTAGRRHDVCCLRHRRRSSPPTVRLSRCVPNAPHRSATSETFSLGRGGSSTSILVGQGSPKGASHRKKFIGHHVFEYAVFT